jgi:hypothetical protein
VIQSAADTVAKISQEMDDIAAGEVAEASRLALASDTRRRTGERSREHPAPVGVRGAHRGTASVPERAGVCSLEG